MAADLASRDMRLVGRWRMGSAEDAEAIPTCVTIWRSRRFYEVCYLEPR